ncbi:hypothetical protein PVAR5_8064 [Paecilomyces variotii No. 5]|uniref:F-box domain-containing protein n=1 Tax=Byssochlamys spectabilis (strain No. 5 / NBRC 109023) TaxID=1356009 RepID=V5FMX1_BYSSN|nr:hypothetical protein PVAR5_8064 [Paecilomyces variotii No. 5]
MLVNHGPVSVESRFEDGTSARLTVHVKNCGESQAWLIDSRCYRLVKSTKPFQFTPDSLLRACLALQPDNNSYFPGMRRIHHNFLSLQLLSEISEKTKNLRIGPEVRQYCHLLSLPTEILVIILHKLASIDAVAFMAACKMTLKLSELFWGPMLKYLSFYNDSSHVPEATLLTLRLSRAFPSGLRWRWDRQMDSLRSVLDNLHLSAAVIDGVQEERLEQFHGIVQAAPENWLLTGCFSSTLIWPKDSRRLRVFLRSVRGRDYVSGMQFLGDEQHETVGFTSPVYNDILVSRKKRIMRFVIDGTGLRSLNCGENSSSGWSSGTPESLRCWEGHKSFEQSDTHDLTISIIFDGFKIRALGSNKESAMTCPDLLITTIWGRHVQFGFPPARDAHYIYKEFTAGDGQVIDGLLINLMHDQIHAITCIKRKQPRRKISNMPPDEELLPLRPPEINLRSTRVESEVKLYTEAQWRQFGYTSCAKLSNIVHVAWYHNIDSPQVCGLEFFYRDCTSRILGQRGQYCYNGSELLNNETLDTIYIQWVHPELRHGRLEPRTLYAIVFRTSQGRMTGVIDDPSEWRAIKLHPDSMAAWFAPRNQDETDFHVFRLSDEGSEASTEN